MLRSWDQFANLVLTDTKERYFVTLPGPSLSGATSLSTEAEPVAPRKLYADIPRGTYLVRGENVLLIGEVDLDKDDEDPPGYQPGPIEEVFQVQKEAEQERKAKDKIKGRKVGDLWGGEMEASGEVLF